jgi:hypothetical protein
MGRPSEFTQEVADLICERLIGGESLRTICDSDEMPSKSTVCRWLAADLTFRDQYARAREMQADILADETLDIADDGRNDWMEKYDKDGAAVGWQVNGEAIGRSKLRVEARRWYAGKLAPKRYGDKMALTDGDGKPLQGAAIAPVFQITVAEK